MIKKVKNFKRQSKLAVLKYQFRTEIVINYLLKVFLFVIGRGDLITIKFSFCNNQ